jgi:N4-gp56 family major capsid protein
MSQTLYGVNDPKAVKLWSTSLFVDKARDSYWSQRFVGKGENAQTPVQLLTNLEKDSGDTIQYDLSIQLKNRPVFGDAIQEGTEESLQFYSDKVLVDQVRQGVNAGGRMTRKRTLHDLRSVAKARASEWWGRWEDEQLFMYSAGSRGTNVSYIDPIGYTGFAGNAFVAPDANHIVYGAVGGFTTDATLTASSVMDLVTLENAITLANTQGGGTTGVPELRPIRIDGEDKFVVIMNTFQERDLRAASATAGSWLDIQKAATTGDGSKRNPIYKGGLGEYKGAILHSHKAVTTFAFGSGGTVPGARASLLGRQALVMAYGSPGSGMRFDWHEETRDNGNQIVISTSAILGVKQSIFNSQFYGSIAIDTAAKNPNVGGTP